MTDERKIMLESIPGWCWNRDKKWEDIYQEVVDFTAKNSRMPSQHSEDFTEKRLGQWLQTQKMAEKGKRTVKSSDERKKYLENYYMLKKNLKTFLLPEKE